MGRKLYVGNLAFRIEDAALAQLFAEAGKVETATIARDMATGRARGFGFVEMSTDEEAQRAIQLLHDKEFEGRRLVVNEARPRPERGDSRGGHSRGPGSGGRTNRGGFGKRW
jgi:cold-inducible RNA-binding protein